MIESNIESQIKVLLIDDDIEDVEFFQEGLSDYASNAVFIWTKGAYTLVEYLKCNQSAYNIIFLDVKMPHKDGCECLKEIRNMPELDIIPVIMFSTFSFKEDIEETFVNGANLYILKPSNFNSYTKIFGKVFTHDWQNSLFISDKANYFLSI